MSNLIRNFVLNMFADVTVSSTSRYIKNHRGTIATTGMNKNVLTSYWKLFVRNLVRTILEVVPGRE